VSSEVYEPKMDYTMPEIYEPKVEPKVEQPMPEVYELKMEPNMVNPSYSLPELGFHKPWGKRARRAARSKIGVGK